MIITKKASLLTKLVVLAILIYLSTTLLDLHSQLTLAQMQENTVQGQVQAQAQDNAALSELLESMTGDSALALLQQADGDNTILAQATIPAWMEDVARDELGMVKPGEQVFYITN